MIRTLDTQHLARPDVTALFPVDRSAVLQWMMKLVVAFDPWVRPFGGYSILLDPMNTAKMYQEVRRLSLRKEYGDKSAMSSDVRIMGMEYGEWKALPETLAAGLAPIEERKSLSKISVLKGGESMGEGYNPARELASLNIGRELPFRLLPMTQYQGVLDIPAADMSTSSQHAATAAFIRAVMLLNWENIIASGHIVNIPDAPEGVDKYGRAQVARTSRLLGLSVALSFALRTAGLRPYARLAKEPSLRARLLIEGGPGTEEQLAILEEMANLPIHPWLAIADSIGLPGRNKTPWNAVSASLGIDNYLWSSVTGNGQQGDVMEYDPLLGIDFTSIFSYAKDMKLDYEHRRADDLLAIDAAQTLLGFTSSGVRPAISLYGPELEPIFTDGQLMSKAVSPLDLFFKPLLPAQRHQTGRTKWIGDVAIVERGDVYDWALNEAPAVYIEKEDVPYAGEFALQRLAGRMLRPVAEWAGGEYVVAPATIDGIASIFGITAAELTKRIQARPEQWTGVAKIVGERVELEKPKGDAYYISARTRTPGLVPVEMPQCQSSLPGGDELAALQWGYIVAKEKARAMYIRDMEVPVTNVDMSAKLVEFARALIGRRR